MNTDITTADLRRAISLREKIESLQSELASILGGRKATRAKKTAVAKKPRKRRKRHLSPEARARIVAAVKARWERERAKKEKSGGK
jgi:hypothetical protein